MQREIPLYLVSVYSTCNAMNCCLYKRKSLQFLIMISASAKSAANLGPKQMDSNKPISQSLHRTIGAALMDENLEYIDKFQTDYEMGSFYAPPSPSV